MEFKSLNDQLIAQGHELIRSWFPNAKLIGGLYRVGSIAGEPGSSFVINPETGEYFDHANEECRGGDYIALYAAQNGLSQGAAGKALGGGFEPITQTAPAVQRPPSKPKYTLTAPVPDEEILWTPRNTKMNGRLCADCWAYKTVEGDLIGWIARYPSDDGGKTFSPWSWAEGHGWVQQAFSTPRPLYQQEQIMTRPTAQVIVCEGEKAARALSKMMPGIIAMAWPGGASAAKHCDWSVLQGREVILWPDADDPGIKAMQGIKTMLEGVAASVKVMRPHGNMPKGWDAADAYQEGMSEAACIEFIKEATADKPPPVDGKTAKPVKLGGSLYTLWADLGLELSSTGAPHQNMDNAIRVVENLDVLKGRIWFDEWSKNIYTDWDGPIRSWDDAELLNLRLMMQRDIGLHKMSKSEVLDGLVAAAHRNKKNPMQDFLNALPNWDGQPRISLFFCDYFGVRRSAYSKKVGENFWKSLLSRCIEPGCKVDNMVVLEGEQGAKKGQALELIVGAEWYMEAGSNINSNEFEKSLRGKLLVEIGEMHAFSKADSGRVKQLITCRIDHLRFAFDKFYKDYPRQPIFVGTANKSDWHKDETGGRRFWPVRVGTVDLEGIAKVRAQLFAEALFRVRGGEDWWEMPRMETEQEQEERLVEDAWGQPVASWLVGKESVTLAQVLVYGLEIDKGRITSADSVRIARVMRVLGWENVRTSRVDGVVAKIWEQKKKAPGSGEHLQGLKVN